MNTITSGINLSDPAPHKEPERQYYFIEKAKEYVRKEAEEAGKKEKVVKDFLGLIFNKEEK